jgi:predicted dinucleotide-binding enzyme
VVDQQQKKEIIIDFLDKCNAYSDAMLQKYQRQLLDEGVDAKAIQEKIRDWSAYKAFNDVAIQELKTDELDDWFDDD